jgi:collagenase-like PrtC family protease
MKLSVAANWDLDLLDGLARIPEVTSVYAKLPYDIVGGGRAGAVLPAVDWDSAKAYVRAAHERGLDFCYLINAPCLGNREQTREGKEALLAFVGQLAKAGVDRVSVSNLSLAALVRRNYPDLPIRGSVLSWPTNLPRLKFQEELGVDTLILPYSEFNRDFAALARIRKGLRCGLQLFANIACIYHCHYLAEHACSVGHASQACHAADENHGGLDSYLWGCTRRRLLEPEHFLMSRWIRPEDLHHYEALGYDEFKIIDRSRGTAWLLRAAQAYAARRYDGNLLDIVSLEMFGDPLGFHENVAERTRQKLFEGDRAERRVLGRMLQLRQRLFALNVHIDNRALDGFLDGFRSINCAETFCDNCRYCHRYAEKALRYDRAEAARLAAEIGLLLDEFQTARW